jgi:hypothetical protein
MVSFLEFGGMPNRPAPALMLRDGDREVLEQWTRWDGFGASAVKRARIVLLAFDGLANTRIAELTDATVTTVLNRRGRYSARASRGWPTCRVRVGRGRWTTVRSLLRR